MTSPQSFTSQRLLKHLIMQYLSKHVIMRYLSQMCIMIREIH